MSTVPMRPDGALVTTDTAVTTFGVEVAGPVVLCAPLGPRPARMNRDELNEAMALLGDVHDLVGHIPAEIMAGLKVTLLRRDVTALFWLRLLRSIDREARR